VIGVTALLCFVGFGVRHVTSNKSKKDAAANHFDSYRAHGAIPGGQLAADDYDDKDGHGGGAARIALEPMEISPSDKAGARSAVSAM
jgi:hypothetical protein